MTEAVYSPGLEGVIAGETGISTVDEGLHYRGYSVEDLASHSDVRGDGLPDPLWRVAQQGGPGGFPRAAGARCRSAERNHRRVAADS